jgi:hypothetical protein
MTSDIGSTQPPSQPAAAPTQTNSFARIGGALFAPNETFKEIVAKPDFGIPLAVLLIVGFMGAVVIAQHIDFEAATREALEGQNRQMSQEDMDRAARMAGAFTKAIMYFAPVFSVVFYVVIAGVLLLAFRMFGGEGNFKQAFSVTLYAWYPQLIKGILMALVVLSRKDIPADQLGSIVMSNPGFLVDPKQQAILYAVLTSLDVFTIWTLVLLIIGFSFVSGMSKTKSAAVVISLWFVTFIFKLGFAAIGAARMKAA